jgi:hypothetical protein
MALYVPSFECDAVVLGCSEAAMPAGHVAEDRAVNA